MEKLVAAPGEKQDLHSGFSGLGGYQLARLGLPKNSPTGWEWGHECSGIQNALIYVLLGFITLHVAAALYHHFVKHDQVVGHMLFVNKT